VACFLDKGGKTFENKHAKQSLVEWQLWNLKEYRVTEYVQQLLFLLYTVFTHVICAPAYFAHPNFINQDYFTKLQ
jgi:hypothetical protein